MKKHMKAFAGLFMTASMVLNPIMEAMAANSYPIDPGVGLSAEGVLLYPEDEISGLTAATYYLNYNYDAPYAIEGGSWRNSSDDGSQRQVYRITPGEYDENGELAYYNIVSEGYQVTVRGGVSRSQGGSFDAGESGHFVSGDGQSIEDVAYYAAGTQVKVKAATLPEELNLVFQQWTVDSVNVDLDAAALQSEEISFTMPGQSVYLTAGYATPAVEEAPAEEAPAEGADLEAQGDQQTAEQEGQQLNVDASEDVDDPMPADAGNPEQGSGEDAFAAAGSEDVLSEWAQTDENGVLQIGEPEQPQEASAEEQKEQADELQAQAEELKAQAEDANADFFNTQDSAIEVVGEEVYSDQTADQTQEQAAEPTPENQAQEQGEATASEDVQAQEEAPSPAAGSEDEITQPEEHTIRVLKDNGEISENILDTNITAQEGTQITDLVFAPEMEGYTFTGWSAYRTDDPEKNALTQEELAAVLSDPSAVNPAVTAPAYNLTLTAGYVRNEEPAQEETSAAAEPVQEETPSATEPVQEETPAVTEPVQEETPAATEPAQEETPAAAEPTQDETPTVTEPAATESGQEQTTPAADQPAQTEQTETTASETAAEQTAPAAAPEPVTQTITYTDGVSVSVNGTAVASGAAIPEGASVTVTIQGTDTSRRLTTVTTSPEGLGGLSTSVLSGTFSMPASAVSVSAAYVPINTATVTNGSGSGAYAQGETVTITADPADIGWEFSYWNVLSGDVTLADSGAETTTFAMPGTAVQVEAVYEEIKYSLYVENGSGSGEYVMDSVVDLAANWPASGKEFDSWIVISGDPDITSPSRFYASLTMPAEDVQIRATYKDGPDPALNAIQGISQGGEYLKGATITFNAVGNGMENSNPNPGDYRYKPTGYQIGNVNGGWTDGKYSTSMAINAVGDYTLTVTYTKEVFDGNSWVSDGTTDTKSVSFHVVNALSVQTGDNSPILPLAIALGAALVLIIVLVVLKMRRRRK